jgi:hypothetical protein
MPALPARRSTGFEAGDDAVQVAGFGLQRLLAREREQLLGQARAAVDRAPHAVDGAGVAAFAALHRQHFQAARQHRQQVVEVVRDAAGELADRFHLLRLVERGVGGLQRVGDALLLGQVARDLGEAHQLAVVVMRWRR